jgi:hypothetical protein
LHKHGNFQVEWFKGGWSFSTTLLLTLDCFVTRLHYTSRCVWKWCCQHQCNSTFPCTFLQTRCKNLRQNSRTLFALEHWNWIRVAVLVVGHNRKFGDAVVSQVFCFQFWEVGGWAIIHKRSLAKFGYGSQKRVEFFLTCKNLWSKYGDFYFSPPWNMANLGFFPQNKSFVQGVPLPPSPPFFFTNGWNFATKKNTGWESFPILDIEKLNPTFVRQSL